MAVTELKLTLPTIHLNGTGRRDLVEQYESAHNALREAIEKLQQAGPNGRDYYPQGPDAIFKAQDEHRTRLRKLLEVSAELEQIRTHIADAN